MNYCTIYSQQLDVVTKEPLTALNNSVAAKLLQSCLTLCDPIDGSPSGSPVPGILQARTLEWVVISFSNAWKWKVKVKLLSCVWLFATPWTAAYQAPPSMGLSRQEYWSGVPSPSPFHWLLPFNSHNNPLKARMMLSISQVWKAQVTADKLSGKWWTWIRVSSKLCALSMCPFYCTVLISPEGQAWNWKKRRASF